MDIQDDLIAVRDAAINCGNLALNFDLVAMGPDGLRARREGLSSCLKLLSPLQERIEVVVQHFVSIYTSETRSIIDLAACEIEQTYKGPDGTDQISAHDLMLAEVCCRRSLLCLLDDIAWDSFEQDIEDFRQQRVAGQALEAQKWVRKECAIACKLAASSTDVHAGKLSPKQRQQRQQITWDCVVEAGGEDQFAICKSLREAGFVCRPGDALQKQIQRDLKAESKRRGEQTPVRKGGGRRKRS